MGDYIVENLRGFDIKLKYKPGVFAKGGIDSGTKLFIESIDVKDETLIADLGSGSGVVGFVAAKLDPKGHIHLLDGHLRSIELAKENVELNNLRNVEIYLSDLFSAVSERYYHQIFTNPPQQLGNEFLAEVIIDSYKHLKPDGELWLVVKKNVKSTVERFLQNTFGNSKIIAHGKEHVILRGEKK